MNTIAVVSGIRAAVDKLVDIPQLSRANVSSDQSQFVRALPETSGRGNIGLVLTGVMVLVFPGSMRDDGVFPRHPDVGWPP
jgi:multidrug efflux pump subunit AcrB